MIRVEGAMTPALLPEALRANAMRHNALTDPTRHRAELERQPVEHFQAPPYEVGAERKPERQFEKLNNQLASAHRSTPALNRNASRAAWS